MSESTQEIDASVGAALMMADIQEIVAELSGEMAALSRIWQASQAPSGQRRADPVAEFPRPAPDSGTHDGLGADTYRATPGPRGEIIADPIPKSPRATEDLSNTAVKPPFATVAPTPPTDPLRLPAVAAPYRLDERQPPTRPDPENNARALKSREEPSVLNVTITRPTSAPNIVNGSVHSATSVDKPPSYAMSSAAPFPAWARQAEYRADDGARPTAPLPPSEYTTPSPAAPVAPVAPPSRPAVRSAIGQVFDPGAQMSGSSGHEPNGQPPARASISGDVFLDGVRVGRWMGDLMAREVGGPGRGVTGFDPRLGPSWPGALQGN